MQLLRDGPDIPEDLLQAHEEGQVVFFCGAGISMPAGLPSFKRLVELLYQNLNLSETDAEKAALGAAQYDVVIGQLEARTSGGRERLRGEIAKILKPDPEKPNKTVTHEALLRLAQNRKGKTRLVTTNYDRLFELAASETRFEVERFFAPLLPIPKKRWAGLFYLHGLLQENSSTSDLDRLVLSSADFGLAYLTEAWAARFVTELFRNYTVCFVGYSLEDPVLRYMMDALAADRSLGESSREPFAFVAHSANDREQVAALWIARNVEPILYSRQDEHALLHNTLHKWAETYRAGAYGKERIVIETAHLRPHESTAQDDFVGRMLWALCDPSGIPAKRFANLNPVPSLEWLKPLSELSFHYADLDRFGVAADREMDPKVKFSVLRRPSPPSQSPWMQLVPFGQSDGDWDDVMKNLGLWLTRHLDDPLLVRWISENGWRLHSRFALLIRLQLRKLSEMEREGKTRELEIVRENAPRAIPRPLMRRIWSLFVNGQVKDRNDASFHVWVHRFRDEGPTAALRTELRDLLRPKVSFYRSLPWPDADQPDSAADDSAAVRSCLRWEYSLSWDHILHFLSDLQGKEDWRKLLPELLPDFEYLLRELMDVMKELEDAGNRSDETHWSQPSIASHEQNSKHSDWTALIKLTRDAWLATTRTNRKRAQNFAENWMWEPYPVFRRLSLFAATHEDIIPREQAVDWLLADEAWWLWSLNTRREAIRLLCALVPTLNAELKERVETTLLRGPPRDMYPEDLEEEKFEEYADHDIWLRLAKMQGAGVALGQSAQARLETIGTQYPEWQIREDGNDEFAIWTSSEDDRAVPQRLPRELGALIDYLETNPEADYLNPDNWREVCREELETASGALLALARKDKWFPGRWETALAEWSAESFLARSWRCLAPTIVQAPDDVLQASCRSAARWVREVAAVAEGQDTLFLAVCKRLLDVTHRPENGTSDPLTAALNHPVGDVTEGLLQWWFRTKPQDAQGLEPQLRMVFSRLCDAEVAPFSHGRVWLAARAIALFRVDPEWTKSNLLPFFDWNRQAAEVVGVWSGFLMSARLYLPFIDEIKVPFLDTAGQYDQLGERGSHYALLLLQAALAETEIFSKQDIAEATGRLPNDGLQHTARLIAQMLRAAGAERGEFWNTRVRPYFEEIWPNSREPRDEMVHARVAEVCVAAEESFPDALATLKHWLLALGAHSFPVTYLQESGICEEQPERALDFLDRVVDTGYQFAPTKLKSCLDEIEGADASLRDDPRFISLLQYWDTRGFG